MQLEQLDKHIHITQLPAGVEVMFAGQPCLNIMENSAGYFWRINPLFAKLAYGANVFDDVPFCMESVDTIEEAIALGLESLHELGAFSTAVDLPEDSYVEEHLDESVQLDEVSHQELLDGAQKAYIAATKQGNGVMAANYAKDIEKHKAAIAKAKKLQSVKESEDQLDESAPAAYVTAKKYSWGTMKHVNVGHAFSIPMHPKHHAAVEKMEDGATHRFTDETNKQWKVKRTGDNLNFSHRDVGQTNVSLSQLKSAGTNESVNEVAYEKDMDDKKPVVVSGVKGMKSTPFKKKFKSMAHYEKWTNTDEFGNHEVHHVEQVRESEVVFDEEFMASLMEDCRAEALKHSTNLLEAHALAQGLFESFIEELDEQAKYRRDDLEGKAHKTWTDDDGSEHKEGMDGPESGDELNRRSIHGTEKRVRKDGTITKSEKYAQGTLKSLIKFNKKLGGLTGPKGQLPESVEELNEAPKFGMDDIAVGGTVIYKTLKGDHKISKVRHKGNGFALHLQDGSTIQNHAVKSTDASDWNHYKDLKESVDEAYGATKKAYDPFASAISKVMSRPAFSAPTKDEPEAAAPKKKTGRPSNGPDVDELRERMKENMKDGKRLHHGFERKDKVKAIRANIHKEAVFGDYHTGKAGRTVGTTKEAQAAKAEENKKTKLDNVLGRWLAGATK